MGWGGEIPLPHPLKTISCMGGPHPNTFSNHTHPLNVSSTEHSKFDFTLNPKLYNNIFLLMHTKLLSKTCVTFWESMCRHNDLQTVYSIVVCTI